MVVGLDGIFLLFNEIFTLREGGRDDKMQKIRDLKCLI